MTLVLALEEEFDTSVPDDQYDSLTTVGAVVEAIAAQMNQGG